MRALVTGAAGFIGTNLVSRLLKNEHDVIGTDSLSRRGSERNLQRIREKFPNFKFAQVEIEDLPSLIHKEKPEIIYHFAAQVAVTTSITNPVRDFKINGEGTFMVANAAHDIGVPVVYTSTNKVFGDNVNHIPLKEFETRYDFGGKFEKRGIPEDFPIDAKHHTPYGCSKLVGDIYVREFGGVSNRCSCMYGPNQNGIVDQGWISYIAQQIISKKPVTIYGDGKQVRDALHADDVTRLLEIEGEALICGKPDIRGEVFNVGGGYQNTISLLELCDKWGVKREEIKFDNWRPADQKVFYCDISKAERILGWEPKVSLQNGLDELFLWTKENISR